MLIGGLVMLDIREEGTVVLQPGALANITVRRHISNLYMGGWYVQFQVIVPSPLQPNTVR